MPLKPFFFQPFHFYWFLRSLQPSCSFDSNHFSLADLILQEVLNCKNHLFFVDNLDSKSYLAKTHLVQIISILAAMTQHWAQISACSSNFNFGLQLFKQVTCSISSTITAVVGPSSSFSVTATTTVVQECSWLSYNHLQWSLFH